MLKIFIYDLSQENNVTCIQIYINVKSLFELLIRNDLDRSFDSTVFSALNS